MTIVYTMNSKFDIDQTLEKLKNVALKDGKITRDEAKLISTIIENLESYSELLKRAESDGIIDQSEKNELFEKRMEVMEDAYDTARDDSNISDDEAELLKQVCHLIMQMERD